MPTVRRSAAVAGLAAVAVLAPAAPALARPAYPFSVRSVAFSGQAGDRRPSPTLTITGTGFGLHRDKPKGVDNDVTSCGPYTANGSDYEGNLLYFDDTGHFNAGHHDDTGGSCVGIVIREWSKSEVVLQFGNAYGTFDHWYLTNGDTFTIWIKGNSYSGTISGLT